MSEITFEDKGDIDVPEKGDVNTEKMAAEVRKKVQKENIETVVRKEEGAEKPVEKKGSMTKDVPQLVFKICAKVIGCKNFELDDSDAQTFATHLNILIPIEGKLASLVVLVMITLNKVYICMDVITAKFASKGALEERGQKPSDLPEPLK
jgi:hypothetical protein